MNIKARQPIIALVAVALVGAVVWVVLHRQPAVHPETERFLARQPAQALAAGFSSYSSVSDVLEDLAGRQLTATRQTISRAPDPRYPPHALDTLTVDKFVMLGSPGQLNLQFFNDRLFELDFKPADIAACSAAVKRDYPQLLRDRNGRAEVADGDLRIASNIELAVSSVGQSLRTEPYVLWQDLRLIGERDEWDQRFGALPYKMR